MLHKYKNHFLLHLIVFIWGFTAILGRLISLPASSLVWYRMIIAVAGIYIYLTFKKVSLKISFVAFLKFMGISFLITLHWIFFYHAIKVSNVSVTLACFSSGALFTALIEPLFFKRRIIFYELLFGLIVIGALCLIFNVETKYTQGIILSIGAALTSSLFSVLNGTLVKKYDSTVMSFYEIMGGIIFMTGYFLLSSELTPSLFFVSYSDLIYLLILGLVCTAFTFVIAIEIMKEISPYTITLSVTLESIYGIILAYFIFGKDEIMSTGFYIGTMVILATVVANAILKRYRKN